MASRHQQEIKTFQLEKREKSEQIKKLHDQISAKSESEERYVYR